MAEQARREMERIAEERRRQAEIEEKHKQNKADDIDKARSEGYSDMIDQVDMEEVLLNAAAANDGKFTDAWRELGQSVRDQPDEWQRESVVSGLGVSKGVYAWTNVWAFYVNMCSHSPAPHRILSPCCR